MLEEIILKEIHEFPNTIRLRCKWSTYLWKIFLMCQYMQILMSGFDMVWGAWNDCNMVKVKMANLIVIIKRYLKISLVRTPFPLNFLCENAVPMRSRPTTPLHFYIKIYRMLSKIYTKLNL